MTELGSRERPRVTVVDPRHPPLRPPDVLGDHPTSPPYAAGPRTQAVAVLALLVAGLLVGRALTAGPGPGPAPAAQETGALTGVARHAGAGRSAGDVWVQTLRAFPTSGFSVLGGPQNLVRVDLPLHNGGQAALALVSAGLDAGSFQARPGRLAPVVPQSDATVSFTRPAACRSDDRPPATAPLPAALRLVVRTPAGPRPLRVPLPPDRRDVFARALLQACGFLPPEQALEVSTTPRGPLTGDERRARSAVVRVLLTDRALQPARVVGVTPHDGLRIGLVRPARLPAPVPPGSRGRPGPPLQLDLLVHVEDCTRALRAGRNDGTGNADALSGRAGVPASVQEVDVALDVAGRRPLASAYRLRGRTLSELVRSACPQRR